ncbi:hypothetical protein [Streptomyces neyagawaensis]|uniref:hypothetical protein n=1 Tax=Streptomyces neyagawaensis TaxID=42238 RepID=UPI00201D19CF|nr:hypothetical protein [Streptomyces neyagawaensis]MCL6734887.1 hypothetical protein [Streptomyces neyagawaensis]MDE1686447.1 hypothetical protein [Streptomyces neyagawaensis]
MIATDATRDHASARGAGHVMAPGAGAGRALARGAGAGRVIEPGVDAGTRADRSGNSAAPTCRALHGTSRA